MGILSAGKRAIREHLPPSVLPTAHRLNARLRELAHADETRASDHYDEFEAAYGDFGLGESYEHLSIRGVDKESGAIRGSIVHVCRTLPMPSRVLLPGEESRHKAVYASILNLGVDAFTTAGVLPDVDHAWDFEHDPPPMGAFDLSISQAMLEHLIDPYKHVRDLASMTAPGGHIVLHTHPPGFKYHRYPVDCLRFWPDWFETVAERIGFDVVTRYVGGARILYVLRNPG